MIREQRNSAVELDRIEVAQTLGDRVADGALAAAQDAQPLGERYHILFRTWFAFGIPAFAAVLGIIWLMVVKPA